MSNELCHHGIKGMRWGVIRDRSNDASSIVKGGHTVNDGIASIHNYKESRSKMSVMSDEELQERIRRLNLEQQYSALANSQKSRGYTYVKGALEIAGGAVAVAGSIATIAAAFKTVPAVSG